MTTTVRARAVTEPGAPFSSLTIERRSPGPQDVVIDIAYVGVCFSDIQYARSAASFFPLVPGHEITGHVSAIGAEVTGLEIGDRVGVGCMVDSCGKCEQCRAGLEQFCRDGYVRTYSGLDHDGRPTLGGYSEKIVVDRHFVVRIPEAAPLDSAAPLLCAGITMYSPLRHWSAGPERRVAIVGFGGLGHVGVQLAHAMGAHTTVLDLSSDKRDDALRLGADEYRVVSREGRTPELDEAFDLIISTVPASVDLDPYLAMLRLDGTIVLLGASREPFSFSGGPLRSNRRSIAGTRIGGVVETQEMMDFCAAHGVAAEVEVIGADRLDEAFRRTAAGDVRFRFVLDVGTLAED